MINFVIDSRGKAIVPWFEESDLDDFGGDVNEFQDYLHMISEEYVRIAERLQPCEPHPMHYEDSWDSPEYQSRLRIWEHGQALDQHRAKYAPPATAPPMSKDQRALWTGGDDAEEAQERIEMSQFIQEQLEKAAEHEAAGRLSLARHARQRAEQYIRALKKREKTPYQFEERENAETIEWGESELSKMINWSASELADQFDEVKAMVVGHRQMADSEFSFVLTGQDDSLRLSKINHPGIPAKDLHARIGKLSDENLLLKLKGHGVETRPHEPEPEEPKKVTIGEATNEDWENYTREQESKTQENNLQAEVIPGMFPSA